MTFQTHNLFNDIPLSIQQEFFETLAESGAVRIERIVSEGQATPPGEWLEQGWDEWVLLLSGRAGIFMDGDRFELELKPGDYLTIPAGCRHRVTWTDNKERTVWLAVHSQKINA